MAFEAAAIPLTGKHCFESIIYTCNICTMRKIFVVAGITNAKERSWLDPANAGELVLFYTMFCLQLRDTRVVFISHQTGGFHSCHSLMAVTSVFPFSFNNQ